MIGHNSRRQITYNPGGIQLSSIGRSPVSPHRIRAIQMICLSCLTLLIGSACTSTQRRAARIDAFMALNHDYGRFNGTVLVSVGGKKIFAKGYGFANMEWDIPNQPDTRFRLGSITKQFTAMLVMQLVEAGKVELDGTISDYLPFYRTDTGKAVTIHHLLSHTSGIPSYTRLPDFVEISRSHYSVDEFITRYCSGDLEFEPGNRFSYSNSGYYILGALIEAVAGKTYEEVLNENILAPLGMKNTGYDHNEVVLAKRASGYIPTMNGFMNAPFSDMSVPYAAGGMYSTAEDMYLWDRCLYTTTLLSEQYRDRMFTPVLNDYAYGWHYRRVPLTGMQERIQVMQHVGGIRGFYSLITREVDNRYFVLLLNNTAKFNDAELQEITAGILNILRDKPYAVPKKPAARMLYEAIKSAGIEAAVTQYRRWRTTARDEYDLREEGLVILGYELLGNGKLDAAIEVFTLAVEGNPNSYNAYDSLGEAYAAKGDVENAIENYRISLQLNPENSNAQDMLKRLGNQRMMGDP